MPAQDSSLHCGPQKHATVITSLGSYCIYLVLKVSQGSAATDVRGDGRRFDTHTCYISAQKSILKDFKTSPRLPNSLQKCK